MTEHSEIDRLVELLNRLEKIVEGIYSSDETLEAICALFCADSGCLWEINRQSGSEVFFLTARINRPDIDEVIEEKSEGRKRAYQLKYDISASNTVSTRIFRDEKPHFGKIGESPFSEAWLEKEHTKGLSGLGMKYIALLPIIDGTGEPVASISLYARDKMKHQDIYFLDGFSKYFSRLWINSHIRVDEVRLEQSLLRHEIVGDMIVIGNALEKLDRYLERALPENSLSVTDQSLGDIRAKITSVETTLSASGIFDRALVNRQNNQFVELRETINSTVQPLLNDIPRRRLSLDSIFYPDPRLEIRMHPTDLAHIVRNVVENALKYSIPGSSIKIEITEARDTIQLTVSNLSEKMEPGEIKRIFGARVRGRRSAESNVEGTGLGLYVVQQLCNIYGLECRIWQDKLPNVESGAVWSRLRVSFGRDRYR